MTLRIGLTGGIGTGKSTVAELLAARGAAVVDADVVAREVVAPGGPAYDAVVGRFGDEVLAEDGTIDRAALAARVFSDPAALADLNALTHPAIGARMAAQLEAIEHAAGGGPTVAVAVVPLLRQAHVAALALAAVAVVDCPTEVAVRRLVEARGMDEADARARVAAQPTREERLALADFVVENGSTRAHVEAEVERLWRTLLSLAGRDASGRRAPTGSRRGGR